MSASAEEQPPITTQEVSVAEEVSTADQPAAVNPSPFELIETVLTEQEMLNYAMRRSQGDRLSMSKFALVTGETYTTRCAPFPVVTPVGLRMGWVIFSTEAKVQNEAYVRGTTGMIYPASWVGNKSRWLEIMARWMAPYSAVERFVTIVSTKLDPTTRRFVIDPNIDLEGDSWTCAAMLCFAGGTLIASSGGFNPVTLETAASDVVEFPMNEYARKAALAAAAGLPGIIVACKPQSAVDVSQLEATVYKLIGDKVNVITVDIPMMLLFGDVKLEPGTFIIFPIYTATEAITAAAYLTSLMNKTISQTASSTGVSVNRELQAEVSKLAGEALINKLKSTTEFANQTAEYERLKAEFLQLATQVNPTTSQNLYPETTIKAGNDFIANIEQKKRISNIPAAIKFFNDVIKTGRIKLNKAAVHKASQGPGKGPAVKKEAVDPRKVPVTIGPKASTDQAKRLAALLAL